MFDRLLNIPTTKSFFLFGARGTGKTSLLATAFPPEVNRYINLLEADVFDSYLLDPQQLARELNALPESSPRTVVIDEIQKLPKLLDVVHSLIEESKRNNRPLRFAMTGSSARKLKRGSANLLAGRALVCHLFPLTHRELAEDFDLRTALEWGSLPEVWTDTENRAGILRAYAQTYLKEEVWDEHVVRRLEPFRRFLDVAAQSNGQIVNYSAIARDVGADTATVQEYFHILEDTLIGTLLEPFHESVRKRQRTNPKFYFFDCGVQRSLSNTLNVALVPQTYAFGRAFEHFLICEIFRLSSYLANDFRLSYLRSGSGAEVDLVIERPGLPTVLVEIKSTTKVSEADIRSLQRFQKDFEHTEAFCFSLDPAPQKFGNVTALPWSQGLQHIGL